MPRAAVALAAVVVLATAGAAAAKPAPSPVVATDRGPVRGAIAAGMRQFLSIPYAAPPTGALRFRPPQLHARWHGVRDATSFGSPCPQTSGPFGLASTNEDCLYLNVFTSATAHAGSRLPVFFWIHG